MDILGIKCSIFVNSVLKTFCRNTHKLNLRIIRIEHTSNTMSNATSIYKDYIDLTKKYVDQYGKNTVVLMQVGAFFEVYGFKCPRTGNILKSEIVEFSQLCSLNIAEKKIVYNGDQVLMAGFRDYSLDKYVQKLTENGFTAVVYVQQKEEGKTTIHRVLDNIHSAGTYVSFDAEQLPQMTNNIACVWVETLKKTNDKMNKMAINNTRGTLVVGIAIANTYTGKSGLTEYQAPYIIQPSTFDDLERIITVHSPNELVLVSQMDDNEINNLLQYSGINLGDRVHRIRSDLSEKALHCTKQKYIKHVLSTFYDEEIFETCSEFQMYPTATQAFCYLMNFIHEHNPNLVKKIAIPDFNSLSSVILANHTLKQLNILDDGANQDSRTIGKLSSVSSFLNKCCTPMGKRKFHIQLVSPTIDTTWLTTEYETTTRFLTSDIFSQLSEIRKILTQVRDIEKLCRQIVLRKIYPSSIYNLYHSISLAKLFFDMFDGSSYEIQEYLCDGKSHYVKNGCNELIEFVNRHLCLDRCKTISSIQTFDENIIQSGISNELDQAVQRLEYSQQTFDKIRSALNLAMQEKENNSDTDFVKVHLTEKSGTSLQITKKRGQILKQIANGNGHTYILGPEYQAYWSELKLSSASTSSDEIELPLLHKTCKSILHEKEVVNSWIGVAYNNILIRIEAEFYDVLEAIASFLAKLDVLQCKAHIAREYHYCCPEIVEDAPKAFIQATDLRHVLIEHIQTNEIYVANSVTIGKEKEVDGILLYGTNAVGKTSFIRSVGVSLIMAQAGLFVPCTKFQYKPYKAIFSRILGNDNLFKGLSTFAVEMSELRVILKMADENSLVLGDELCSGTETESALSIFVSGLTHLHEARTSFLFATHFHEIIKYDEVKALKRLSLKHMAVRYDRELDALVYDRKLLDGPGNRMYGLEVCKSLHLPEVFLEKAYSIRSKYFPENASVLSDGLSTYNAQKIRGCCEICKELGEEIHHIEPQYLADKTGYVVADGNVFHKNHPANLLAVCKKCHDNLHFAGTEKSPAPIAKKKTTKGYKISSKNNVASTSDICR